MFKKRTLAVFVTIFAIGVGFGIFLKKFDTSYFRFAFASIAIVSVLVCVALRFFKGATINKRITAAAFAVAAFSFGICRVSAYNASVTDNEKYNGMQDVAEFEIIEINNNYLEVKIIASELGLKSGELIRYYPETAEENYLIGDKLKCEINYKYKFTNSMLSNGSVLTAQGTVLEHYDGNGFFYEIRKSVCNSSNSLFKNFRFASGISRGVTIGDRSNIDSYTYSIFRTAGISHLLAISGLHISLITLVLQQVLLCFSVNARISSLISSIFALIYAALVGFTPGAVRSVVMIICVMVMQLFFYQADGFTSIFLALGILLIINPYSLCSASLQLSFLCTLSIMLTEPFTSKLRHRILKGTKYKSRFIKVLHKVSASAISSAIISFASAIFTFPILFMSFDTFSYVAIIANIIAVPIFTWAIYFCVIGLMLAPISVYLALPFAYVAGSLFDLVTYIAKIAYDLDIGIVSVHRPFSFIPLLLSFSMVAALIFLTRKRFLVFGITSCMFCVSLLICGVLNHIGINDKAILEYSDSSGEYVYFSQYANNLYIDIGGYTANSNIVYETGKTALDNYVVLTYSDYSFNRLNSMSGNMRVYNIYLPNPKNVEDTACFYKIKELANERNCDIIIYDDYLSKNINSYSSVQVLGLGNRIDDETLISIDVNGNEVHFLCNGYSGASNCDIAILTDDFSGEESKINSEVLYCEKDYTEHNPEIKAIPFEETVRFKFDN